MEENYLFYSANAHIFEQESLIHETVVRYWQSQMLTTRKSHIGVVIEKERLHKKFLQS